MFEGARDRFDVLQLRAADDLSRSPSLPDTLAPAPDLADGRGRGRADWTFGMRGCLINDRSMDMSRIDEVVEVGTTEIWEVSNADGSYHNFHVHDVQFQVVDIGGKPPPPPELAGWKDTIFLPRGRAARLAMRFRDYTDPDLPYMYHCPRLRHEDRGMMGLFVVVEPGQAADTPPQPPKGPRGRQISASAPWRPRPTEGTSMLTMVRNHWDGAPGYQRLAYLAGAALITTGLVHAGIWAVVGGSADGPLSWRKPVTFGISFGLTTVTLAWVAAYLPVRRGLGWLLSILLCATTTYEVAWVSVQHARGIPSHFNDTTTLDENLFIAGAVAVAIAILVIAAITLAAFIGTTAPPPMGWAIRSGLLALLAAQLVGLWMLLHGLSLLDDETGPLTQSMSTYGAAGSMKFAHAVPMHAIQVLAVLAGLLSLTDLTQRRQLRLVTLAVIGYAGLFAIALLRTAAGEPPFDLFSATMAGYLVAAGLLAGPAVIAAAGLYRAATSGR